MSKLDELIQELCPDGVEYKRFNEVCTLNARIGWQRLTKSEHQKTGDYMLITGTDFTETYNINYNTCVYVTKERYEQDKKIQLRNDDVLITKDGTIGKVAYINNLPKPTTLNSGVFVVRDKDNKLLQRYIMHYLLSGHFTNVVEKQKTGSTISHLTQGLFEKLLVPVPPLPIQEEIVRILDKFTNATIELQKNLQAELKLRKKQYEYYRDALLTFEEGKEKTEKINNLIQELCPDGVEYKTLGECCKLSAGGDAPKGSMSKERTDIYKIPIYSNGIDDNSLYGYTDNAKIFERAITISARGTIGYCTLRKEPFYPIIRLITGVPYSNIVSADYLRYIINTIKFKVPEGGIPQLTVPMVSKISIPIPPLPIQEEIVRILDKFDTLCNDLSKGLPREIELRQKQYEYYRDKLLTFKVKER